MKCLRKYTWVKLYRECLPEGKGLLGYWAKLAARAAYRKGHGLYCGHRNRVTAGMWTGGIVGLKSILGVKRRDTPTSTDYAAAQRESCNGQKIVLKYVIGGDMMTMKIRTISPGDRFAAAERNALLRSEGISLDPNLDYSCGLYDEEEELVATGSILGNTLRCLAVSKAHRGEGLLVQVVSHLMAEQASRGYLHVYIYTKPENLEFFSGLGFYEIARTPHAVFLENIRDGFLQYCAGLEQADGQNIAAVVMNANPFTLGHRHLLETAAKENDVVHLFLLSENVGPIPFEVRRRLVTEGIVGLPNVVLHETGSYMISAATFPSYFLPDDDTVIRTQAELDLEVFCRIADMLKICCRYVGQEPASWVTGIYNDTMCRSLPEKGIDCKVIPRQESNERVISASTVRQAIHDNRLDDVRDMLPDSTYRFFTSAEGEQIAAAIRLTKDVIHY